MVGFGFPETVGQYTSLKDRYREEIFEGDILGLMSTRKAGYSKSGIIVKRLVSFGEFYARDNTLYRYTGFHLEEGSITYFIEQGAVVIGNIHDNPELLEVAK